MRHERARATSIHRVATGRWSAAILLVIVALTWAGCGRDSTPPTTPTPPNPTPPPAAPTLTGVSIAGNLALTQIGETSQLTATARLSDGTTQDVTSSGAWTSNDSRVATISPGGLLTVTGFGATFVSFAYQSRGTSRTVTATAPGTFVIAGRVREPGAGSLSSVLVVDQLTGRSTTTAAGGNFSLAELPRLEARLRAEKEGYEPAENDAKQANVDLPMQRVVRLTAGQTVSPAPLAPNDLTYAVGEHRCDPCRLIRVVVPQAGAVQLNVNWTPATSRLSLFAEGQVIGGQGGTLSAEIPVSAPRELVVYVGGASTNAIAGYANFTFATSLR